MVGPAHEVPPFVKVGVTIIVAVTGVVEVLAAVNDMLPLPLAARPMLVVLFVHV